MRFCLVAVALALVMHFGLIFASCGDDPSTSSGQATDDDTHPSDDDAVADDDLHDDDAADDDTIFDDDVTDDDAGPVRPIYGHGVWPDETGPDVLAQWYPLFAEMSAVLHVEVLEEWIEERNPEVARIFHEAHAAGVSAQPYIILPVEDGMYPNENNFEQFFAAVKAMIQWAEEEDLHIEWIGVDMETPVQMVDQINQYLFDFQFLQLYAFLLSHRDPAAFAQAVANYQTLVDYCHAHGMLVHVVCFPFVLDDYADADFGIQDAFDMPVSGVNWDQVDFMVYRTMYQGYSRLPFTSDLVYRYARRSIEIFGDKASIFIGLVLWPGWFEGDLGYQDPAELEADIEAALAAGIGRINIFYLTGLLNKEDVMAWMDPDVSDFQVPPRDPFTTLLVDIGMPILDMLL